jgi:hypothetical protein
VRTMPAVIILLAFAAFAAFVELMFGVTLLR